MKRFLPLIIIIVVLVAALTTTWIVIRSRNGSSVNSNVDNSRTPGAQPPHFRGNQNATVTVEEFGDFQCPMCGNFYPEVKKMENEYGDKLRVIFREYPLYPQPHRHALMAAQAAEAAGLQGRFWEMHDKLYENQKAWSDVNDLMPVLIQFAKEIGLDTARFSRELNDDSVRERITQDGIRAHALNVTGTPTFFVNSKALDPGSRFTPEGLRALINEAVSVKASK